MSSLSTREATRGLLVAAAAASLVLLGRDRREGLSLDDECERAVGLPCWGRVLGPRGSLITPGWVEWCDDGLDDDLVAAGEELRFARESLGGTSDMGEGEGESKR